MSFRGRQHDAGAPPERRRHTRPLLRLRYGGSAGRWDFAIYLASSDSYEVSAPPTGIIADPPEDAPDSACGLYLGDPTPPASEPPTN